LAAKQSIVRNSTDQIRRSSFEDATRFLWQLRQETGKKHKSAATQVKGAEVGLNHSHAGTGTAISVMIMER